MARCHLSPAFSGELVRHGLSDYGSIMGYAGGCLVAAHRGRSTVRIDGNLWLKRFPGDRRPLRRELRARDLLAAGAGPDPVPVAAWGEGPEGSFLLTVTPPGVRPLPDVLRALRGDERRTLLAALGRCVRALHDRGLTCPDLHARHVLAGRDGRVFLIDAGRLGRRRGRFARAIDLAALDRSLPFGAASDADRVRVLSAYLGATPSRHPAFLAGLDRADRKLSKRFRHRRGSLVAAPEDLRFLESIGIRTFADLLGFTGEGAVCLRKLPDRENWRIEAGGRCFFVKRHGPVRGCGPTPAAVEWEAVRLFRRAGIRTMRAVAMGEDVSVGSTIWVERAPGAPLDDLLRSGSIDFRTRREIVIEAASILARMRRREMHHRDMYACHLIADPSAPPGERLTVIDLQRVRRKRGLRERWYVKDAAQLHHSAPRPPVTRTDRVRFLRRYFGVGKLGRTEKAFARKVLRKAARIRRNSKSG